MEKKKTYARPQIMEYGRLADLTLGQSGGAGDFVLIGSQRVDINNSCNPSLPHPGLICS